MRAVEQAQVVVVLFVWLLLRPAFAHEGLILLGETDREGGTQTEKYRS